MGASRISRVLRAHDTPTDSSASIETTEDSRRELSKGIPRPRQFCAHSSTTSKPLIWARPELVPESILELSESVDLIPIVTDIKVHRPQVDNNPSYCCHPTGPVLGFSLGDSTQCNCHSDGQFQRDGRSRVERATGN